MSYPSPSESVHDTKSWVQGDVPQLPNILPQEPPRPSSTPVAALSKAADAVQSTSASVSSTATTRASPTSPKGSSAALDQPAASSTASAITQQAALRSGAGSVTSQRGQGWLRAMWNRSVDITPPPPFTFCLGVPLLPNLMTVQRCKAACRERHSSAWLLGHPLGPQHANTRRSCEARLAVHSHQWIGALRSMQEHRREAEAERCTVTERQRRCHARSDQGGCSGPHSDTPPAFCRRGAYTQAHVHC